LFKVSRPASFCVQLRFKSGCRYLGLQAVSFGCFKQVLRLVEARKHLGKRSFKGAGRLGFDCCLGRVLP
jgi:hypothetical protein